MLFCSEEAADAMVLPSLSLFFPSSCVISVEFYILAVHIPKNLSAQRLARTYLAWVYVCEGWIVLIRFVDKHPSCRLNQSRCC